MLLTFTALPMTTCATPQPLHTWLPSLLHNLQVMLWSVTTPSLTLRFFRTNFGVQAGIGLRPHICALCRPHARYFPSCTVTHWKRVVTLPVLHMLISTMHLAMREQQLAYSRRCWLSTLKVNPSTNSTGCLMKLDEFNGRHCPLVPLNAHPNGNRSQSHRSGSRTPGRLKQPRSFLRSVLPPYLSMSPMTTQPTTWKYFFWPWLTMNLLKANLKHWQNYNK